MYKHKKTRCNMVTSHFLEDKDLPEFLRHKMLETLALPLVTRGSYFRIRAGSSSIMSNSYQSRCLPFTSCVPAWLPECASSCVPVPPQLWLQQASSADVAVIQAVCVLVCVVCERMEGRPPPPCIGSFILGSCTSPPAPAASTVH